MLYGRIERGLFVYTGNMACVYFLNDGYVYAAFNGSAPNGWISLTEEAFITYTREMYADTLTWGVGKPLIQIANTNRYGIVMLTNNVTDDSPNKVATAHSVKLAYDIAVEAFNSVNASGNIGGYVFETLKYAKDSSSHGVFSEDGSTVTETVRNVNNSLLLAEKVTTFHEDGSITGDFTFYEPDGTTVKATYTTTTVFNGDGSITSTTV